MPWTGWNESDVRPQARAAIGGFTAINSSSPTVAPRLDLIDSASSARQSGAIDYNATVASAYLGRGEEEPPASVRRPSGKKAASKSKKRATTAPSAKHTKRRKTSNVNDALPTTKPRATPKKQTNAKIKTKPEDRATEAALQHERSKNTRPQILGTAAEADSTSASALVSVIAPSTSMNALHRVSQQTSFDAARSTSRGGATLYSSSSSLVKQQNRSRAVEPPSAHATHRSVQAKAAGNSAANVADRHEEFTIDEDDAGFGALLDELAQEIEGMAKRDSITRETGSPRVTRSAAMKIQGRHTCRAAAPTRDEDCLLHEDWDDELMEATIAAESAPKKTSSAKKAIPRQLPTPVQSDASENNASIAVAQPASNNKSNPEEAFALSSDDEDEEMIELEKAIRVAEKLGLKPRLHKQNVRLVNDDEDYGGALLDEAEKQLLDELRSASPSSDAKPIVRSSFPQPILDRSPIFGASNTTVIRTCFRLGEVLNVGSQAVRMNKNVILEIYARVASSFRDGRKQHFIFRDLYHDKLPHLEGDFELWSQSRLWELDGKAFLKAEHRPKGVMCRAVAKMKRDGTKWRLDVLSIWEASWEDVEVVAGIYGKDGEGMGINEE